MSLRIKMASGVAAVLVSVGLVITIGGNAHAAAGVQRIHNGVSPTWGPYTQVVFTKTVSNQMYKKRAKGDAAAAIAAWACAKIPNGAVEATCMYWLSKHYAHYRAAIDDAHQDPNLCVAVQWYILGPAQALARTSQAVRCNTLSSGGGGAGGGGGGSSWKTVS